MKELSNHIFNCVIIVDKSLSELNNLLARKSGQDRIMALYKEATNIENMADDLLRISLRDLMKISDPIKIIKFKEIYEDLETITDRCVDVLDIISDITLRFIYSLKSLS